MGKILVAFSMFLAASALAIHESKAPPPPPPTETAPLRALPLPEFHEAPPWVRYAAPPQPAPVAHVEPAPVPSPPVVTVSEGDVPDVEDRCPDQPTDDDDGCPEVTKHIETGEIILIE